MCSDEAVVVNRGGLWKYVFYDNVLIDVICGCLYRCVCLSFQRGHADGELVWKAGVLAVSSELRIPSSSAPLPHSTWKGTFPKDAVTPFTKHALSNTKTFIQDGQCPGGAIFKSQPRLHTKESKAWATHTACEEACTRFSPCSVHLGTWDKRFKFPSSLGTSRKIKRKRLG